MVQNAAGGLDRGVAQSGYGRGRADHPALCWVASVVDAYYEVVPQPPSSSSRGTDNLR